MTEPRFPANTPAQRRAAIHAAVDRVLDTRPDLEAGLIDLFGAVSAKLASPGVMASAQLFAAGKRLFDQLDRPGQPPRQTGFRAR